MKPIYRDTLSRMLGRIKNKHEGFIACDNDIIITNSINDKEICSKST